MVVFIKYSRNLAVLGGSNWSITIVQLRNVEIVWLFGLCGSIFLWVLKFIYFQLQHALQMYANPG